MKSVAQIMEDLGFRPDGSDEVKKAFIKNLIKQAQISEEKSILEAGKKPTRPEPNQHAQYSLFDQKKSG